MSAEFYDHKAAIAGRVHRRRPERRAYPGRKADWNTADYVRAYFTLNTRQPSYRDAGSGVYAFAPGEHTSLYQTLGRQAQAPVVNDGIETTNRSTPCKPNPASRWTPASSSPPQNSTASRVPSLRRPPSG